ncbi:MAG: TatD DNase family protein [Actinomycetota bacterium]|nr:TatD DNase family protein [Actinomycetota bacterium]
MWADSHCHLPGDGSAGEVLAAAAAAGVTRIVTIGTDADESSAAIALAAAHEQVWATVGLHPHDAKNGVDTIVAFLDAPKVVAVGECGLDYHYDHSPRDTQRAAFAAQVQLAHERGLALSIHTREAWDDTFAVLTAEGVPDRTVFHCFTGGEDEARRCLDLGAYLSFSGVVTFKKADDVRAAARLCPLDRLVVETDSPFLTPVPLRGQPNVPGNVPLVGAGVSRTKGIDVEQVEAASWANTQRLYELPASADSL